MDLLKKYSETDSVLKTLDFENIFHGFRKYKFALYNSNEVCLDGELIPYQSSFMGNAAISYENEPVAIWNVEMDPVEDAERLVYCLVHEMLHCHQRVIICNKSFVSTLTA